MIFPFATRPSKTGSTILEVGARMRLLNENTHATLAVGSDFLAVVSQIQTITFLVFNGSLMPMMLMSAYVVYHARQVSQTRAATVFGTMVAIAGMRFVGWSF